MCLVHQVIKNFSKRFYQQDHGEHMRFNKDYGKMYHKLFDSELY